MASLTKINGRYHVRVRRKGFKAQCRNFTHKADALKWVRQIEIGLEQGRVVSRDTTFGSLIDRYIEQVSTKKKSHQKEQSSLLRLRQSNLADLYVSKITPAVIAEYRDARLKEVQPATCLRDLNILSHIFSIAMREWGYALPSNPVSHI